MYLLGFSTEMVQLESAYLTTVTINPDLLRTTEHAKKLKALPAMQTTLTGDKQQNNSGATINQYYNEPV